MKELDNIRYILFSILILGCFANFAQNEYGMEMVMWATMLLGLGWLVNLALLGKEIWKKKIVSIILISTFSLFILSVILIVLSPKDIFGFSMLILLTAFVIELLIIAFVNRKQQSSGSILILESFGLFVLFMGSSFKYLHWAGANFYMILSAAILSIVYFIEIFKVFSKFRNGKMIAFFSFLFYLNIILGVIGSMFKNLHWPFSRIFFQTEIVLLVILMIPMLLNLKFKSGSEKINLMALRTKSPVLVFVFVFVSYWALFFSLQVWGVGPRFYTLARPPVLQKMLDKSANGNEPQIVSYSDNYNDFMDHRREVENK